MMILFLTSSPNAASVGPEKPHLWLDIRLHKGIVKLTELQGTVDQVAVPPGSQVHPSMRAKSGYPKIENEGDHISCQRAVDIQIASLRLALVTVPPDHNHLPRDTWFMPSARLSSSS
jgi:hypothetical protein